MAIYNIHAGHNFIVPGANGLIDETTEARKVKDRVVLLIKSKGHTVYDCTDDNGRTQNAILQNIVAKCNAHSVALDVSIHLNSGRGDYTGDGRTGGVEVFCYDSGTKEVAKRIADNISAIGYTKRSNSTSPYPGVKYEQSLYVLRNTKSPAILVECAFVDDVDDVKRWDVEKMAKAIAEGIMNTSTESKYNKWITQNDKKYYITANGSYAKGLVFVGAYRYYFDRNGVMQTGWQVIDGTKYYFSKSTGKAAAGFAYIGKDKYYFSKTTNKLTTGFVFVGADKFYFGTDGILKTGWHTISGKKYYFNTKNGIMWKGVANFGNTKYYLHEKEGYLMYSDKEGRLT